MITDILLAILVCELFFQMVISVAIYGKMEIMDKENMNGKGIGKEA